MTEETIIFLVDKFYFITGEGNVLTGELLNNISVGENIRLIGGGDVHTTTIYRIDIHKDGKREESSSAGVGELVGIWIDFPAEKIKTGMGVFKENDGDTEFSYEINSASFNEMMAFLDTTCQNSINRKSNDLIAQLAKYLIPLKAKEENLVYLDDYGDQCFDLWWEECHKFIDRKLLIPKLEIIEECKLLLKQNFKQNISPETMETFDEYLNSLVIIRITSQIDTQLNDFED